MSARDTAALAAQVDALKAQVGRLANVVQAMTLTTDAIMASFHAGYAQGQADMRPGAGRPRGRHGLRLARTTPDGA